jgi:hypothetical protein
MLVRSSTNVNEMLIQTNKEQSNAVRHVHVHVILLEMTGLHGPIRCYMFSFLCDTGCADC